MMNQTVLVSGATGVLGREICRLLRDQGIDVRAMVRPDSHDTDELVELGCDFATADLLDPASLHGACEGVAQVINTATAIGTLRKGQKLPDIDRDGVLSLVEAAEEAGVGNFTFVSIPPSAEGIRFFTYKRVVEERLRTSPMTTTILQPGAFMDSAFAPENGWNVRTGKVSMIGGGNTRTPFVAVADVAKAAAAVTIHGELQGGEWPIAGPESLSHREALQIFEDVYGRAAKVRSAPAWLVRGLSKIVMPFREDLASIMQIISSDLSTMTVETPPQLRVHLDPMVTVRQFAARQKASLPLR
jgi:uncharacterized protein YbjT (DUF2867 family)